MSGGSWIALVDLSGYSLRPGVAPRLRRCRGRSALSGVQPGSLECATPSPYNARRHCVRRHGSRADRGLAEENQCRLSSTAAGAAFLAAQLKLGADAMMPRESKQAHRSHLDEHLEHFHR